MDYLPCATVLAQIDTPLAIALIVLALGAGVGGGLALARVLAARSIRGARDEATRIIESAETEAKTKTETILLKGERDALERKEKADAELGGKRDEIREQGRQVTKREDVVTKREESLSDREKNQDRLQNQLAERDKSLQQRSDTLDKLHEEQREKLHQVSGLSREQAVTELLEIIEEEERHEVGKRVRQINEEAEEKAREQAMEITLNAIQRYAAETTSESTVRSVPIPSDDMKGRIIGREGRNIRAIEKATGADIIVDDTPGVIVVSCFDKVRQAIAVESLQRLVADGRLHPSRIEDVVTKVTSEIGDKVIKFGKDAVLSVDLRNVNPKIVEAMGKLNYRTSYAQNVLQHSIEVAYFSQIIAEQLGLDGRLARRCGFLHDIGKAMDHEMEGGHPKIGMDFARQYGEKEEVLNAIGGHHGDIPSTSYYTPIVMAADAVSSARPGARRESMERYIQRLNDLQDIALSFKGVVEAHAIQAGREVRVMIDADKIGDDEAYLIAHKVAKRVSEEMTFPGEIKVTVLRETRAIEIAR